MPVFGGTTLKLSNAALAPAQERVALAVALELELDVARDREPRRELVDLHGVVDHELDRDQRVDLLRVAALVAHRVAHRGEVDDARDAGEVLQQHARGREGDLARRLVGRDPAGDGLDLLVRAVAEHVLEQDPQRVRQPRDVPAGLQRVEPVDRIGLDRRLGAAQAGPCLDSSRSAGRRPPACPGSGGSASRARCRRRMFPAAASEKFRAMNTQLRWAP